MTHQYELMVIFDPEIDERQVAPKLDGFLKVITNDGGTIEKVDVWGRRRLAYEIKKKNEGIYAVVDFTATSEATQELDRQLKLSEQIMRTKVLRAEEAIAQVAAEAKRSEEKAARKARRSPQGRVRREGCEVTTMAGETVITVVGNLTADPELRYTQNGLPVANFTIASTPRTFDRQANEWKDGEALFLRASVWREFAEHVAGSLTKGSRVIATGRLKQRSYQDREGNNRTSIELEVDEIGPSLRYATAQVTRAASSGGGGGGGQRAQVQQGSDEPWSTPGSNQGGGADAWSTPGSYGDDTRSDLATPHGVTTPEIPDAEPGRRKRPRHPNPHERRKHGWKGHWRPPQAAEGREERSPREGDPRRRHRLQGRRNPPQVHLGARQDPRPSYHRCLRAGAAPDRPRHPERARDGSPALRRRRPLRSTRWQS